MSDLVLRDPQFLWLLLLLPVIALMAWRRRKTRAALSFPLAHALASAPRGLRARLLWVPTALLMVAVALAAVALARPQSPSSGARRERRVEGIDLAIALDLSSSMQATDLKPHNRLEVAKDVLNEFLEQRPNDRVSLVVFSGAAYTQAPLTLNHAALKEVVSKLRPGVLEDGTAIGEAMGVSLNRLRESTARSRALVLITDGDNNAGRLAPTDAAAISKELGIPVFPILVGKGGVASMPIGQSPQGEVVWGEVEAPVNAELLEQIAQDTGGAFFRATDRQGLADGLNGVLSRMERSPLEDGGATTVPDERFGALLMSALTLAALDLLLRSTLLRVSP